MSTSYMGYKAIDKGYVDWASAAKDLNATLEANRKEKQTKRKELEDATRETVINSLTIRLVEVKLQIIYFMILLTTLRRQSLNSTNNLSLATYRTTITRGISKSARRNCRDKKES